MAENSGSLVRDYSFLALGALAVSGLILYTEGLGVLGLTPVVIGLSGILLRWGAAPGLYLVTLVGTLVVAAEMRVQPVSSPIITLLLAAASLVYVAAQMRLQTLVRHGVPPDPRRRLRPPGRRLLGRWFLPAEASPRSGTQASGAEVILLLASAPVFALAAYLATNWLTRRSDPTLDVMDPRLWQMILVVWATAITLALAWTFLAYLGRTHASVEESRLFLQDQLWTATRGEQRRINSWLVWKRLRRQRKGESK
jgi:hypothetical protein